jgi:hypothetical protein
MNEILAFAIFRYCSWDRRPEGTAMTSIRIRNGYDTCNILMPLDQDELFGYSVFLFDILSEI